MGTWMAVRRCVAEQSVAYRQPVARQGEQSFATERVNRGGNRMEPPGIRMLGMLDTVPRG